MAEFSEAKDSAFPQRIVLISPHLVITFTVWTTYEIDPYHVQLFFEPYCVLTPYPGFMHTFDDAL
jgi:hypothetical protein